MQWWEQVWAVVKRRKTPLTLAVIAQASNIGIWVTQEGKSGIVFLDLFIAVVAAFSIDLIIVSTAFIEKRSQLAWSLAIATSVIALVFSALIAVYIFNPDPSTISIWSGLHISFPVLVFFYSWFLSITEHDDREHCLQLEEEEKRRKQLEEDRKFEQMPVELVTYRQILIGRLLATGLTASAIYTIIGGNKQKTLEAIKAVQEELGIDIEPERTDQN